MKQLVDIVNFNADASCLDAAEWLRALAHGRNSKLCGWLELYVARNKRVTLGFVGGAVADIVKLNPEAIALVNDHPEIFEVVLRSFAHDVTLLRLPKSFLKNLRLGQQIISGELRNIVPFFLPAEFMLTSEQVKLLADEGIEGVFINSWRFKDEVQRLIPTRPYVLKGVLGAELACIPFCGELTQRYLDSLHEWDAERWNRGVLDADVDPVFTWRDGESPFLIPEGVEREDNWLAHEDPAIVRSSLRDARQGMRLQPAAADGSWRSYPVHSFTAWLKEFRMLGYIERVRALEEKIDELSLDTLIVWLQAINSDVLSAVEKDSPVIKLRKKEADADGEERTFTIRRSERGFEGEEYLKLAEMLHGKSAPAESYIRDSTAPHIQKLAARLEYFRNK